MHALLSADPERVGRPDVPPCSDALNEALAEEHRKSSRQDDGGKPPLVTVAGSCTFGLKDDILECLDNAREDRLKRLKIVDSIAWCGHLLLEILVDLSDTNIAACGGIIANSSCWDGFDSRSQSALNVGLPGT